MATPSQRQEVVLYYLGGLTKEGVEGRINSGGRAFALPEIGGPMRAAKYQADDLIDKYNTNGRIVFTFDRNVAVRAARGEDLSTPVTVNSFTREQLLAALAELDEEEAGDNKLDVVRAAVAKKPESVQVQVNEEAASLAEIMAEEIQDEDAHKEIPVAAIPAKEDEVEKPASSRKSKKEKEV